MLDYIFGNLIISSATGTIVPLGFFLCTLGALALGVVNACIHMFRGTYTKNFIVTLALLPIIIQVVIMLVNGSVGAGVAVMGAFSLVRFRSVPGSSKEIGSIFLAMAIGLATGMGYLGVAIIFLIIYSAVNFAFTATSFGEPRHAEKELKITIPEGLDYTGLFDDLFEEYTSRHEMIRVRTTNMGSLYQLTYQIILKDPEKEKSFLDDIRCRNGNLEIICGKVSTEKVEL